MILLSLVLKWILWLRSLRCFTSLLLKWYLWLRSLHRFNSLLLKWNIWLRSLRCFSSLTTLTSSCFTSLLLNGNLWLRSLRCFTFTTIKIKSLNTLTTLSYFTTTNPRYRTTLTTLLLSLIHQIVFPQEFQCFHKICMCHSNFTVRKFSGVLHALLPEFQSSKYLINELPLRTLNNWFTFEVVLTCDVCSIATT